MSKTDLELWRLISKGDAEAWEMLVNRYQALVYTIPVRAGIDLADCADCFQQTWLALYENRTKIKDPNRLSAWLVTTAKRETLKKLKQNCISQDNGKFEQIDNNCLPDEELINLERQAQIEIAIKQLDPRCQKIIEKFFFSSEKSSYEKIAAELDISANSLGVVRRRCLQRLKKILADMEYFDVRNK